MPSCRHSSAIERSPRKLSRTMRILSSAECRLRVARRMPLTISSDDRSVIRDFCLIFAPLRATMSQKSSLPQDAKSVSRVLMSDSLLFEGLQTCHPRTGDLEPTKALHGKRYSRLAGSSSFSLAELRIASAEHRLATYIVAPYFSATSSRR